MKKALKPSDDRASPPALGGDALSSETVGNGHARGWYRSSAVTDNIDTRPVGMPVRHTWAESERFVPRTIVQPMNRLFAHEAAGGIVMLISAVFAIGWANSPWSDSYFDLWNTHIIVEVGSVLHLDHLTLQAWVNDALMTAFFLLVGVEIKREVIHGHLREVRTIALPVLAAIGGMVVPALIYRALNSGGVGSDGWAIPMATDIAFAVGIVTLAGKRVPLPAKVFLLTLAVADDIGAIVVIALFYAGSLSVGWLFSAAAALVVIFLMRRNDVQSLAPYLATGAFLWLALLESGVHATLAGVALGLLTPAWPLRSPIRFPSESRRVLADIERAFYDRVLTGEEFAENEQRIAEVSRLAMLSTSPMERLERALTPWVTYVIVPVFALANAGVSLSRDTVGGLVDDRITLGVVLGLVLGKAVGVLAGAGIGVGLRIGQLPPGVGWRHMIGVAAAAGVGFTVSLFVASLSFDDAATTDAAKVGILAGSAIAGLVGYLILRLGPGPGPTYADGPHGPRSSGDRASVS